MLFSNRREPTDMPQDIPAFSMLDGCSGLLGSKERFTNISRTLFDSMPKSNTVSTHYHSTQVSQG